MKKFLLSVLLIGLPAFIFAGTLFEDDTKTSDPFVGDRGGFNSIFVNPAGTAGQSGFELSVSAGTKTSYNDVQLLLSVADMASSAMSGGFDTTNVGEVTETLTDLYSSGAIQDELLEGLFYDTYLMNGPDGIFGTVDDPVMDWSDADQIQTFIDNGDFDQADADQVLSNLDTVMNGGPGDPQYDLFYQGLPEKISIDAVASLKAGFLIKGFGLGVYDHAVAVAFMDPSAIVPEESYGLETIYNELGVVAGFGFNLLEGKLALGISGNYGILMKNTSPLNLNNITDIIDTSINYGYNWGVDLGAIWRPTPTLGIGVVFNDVVGYTQTPDTYSAAGLMGLISDEAYLMDSVDYQFTLDMDTGISWQPDWRFIRPRLGFDLYNVIGYGRAVAENGDSFEDAMYRSLEHIRVGAQFTFFDFLKIGGQFHNHYLSMGAGLDLLFLELYGEVKIHDSAISEMREGSYGDIPLAGELTVRIHF